MHIVTLTSDWSNDDFYSGAVKGALLSRCQNIHIETLSKAIKPFRISEAAFIVRNAYHHFPEGSIHIIAVGTDPEQDTTLLAARINGHYFLTADNGILGLLGDSEVTEIIEINRRDEGPGTFPTLEIFTEIACKLIEGEKLKELGKTVDSFKKQVPLRATLENDTITGSVIYIDSYGNAITNISRELFDRIQQNREFSIYVQSKHYKINQLNKRYSETQPGDLMAIFNSLQLLEIAIRNGSAKDLLNLNTDSTVRVEFNAKQK
jgi:hypothetical protein